MHSQNQGVHREEQVEISVVVPIYQSEKTIPELCRRLRNTLEEMRVAFELVFVEDGSGDDSLAVLVSEAKSFEHMQVIKLVRNFGQHAAISAGLAATKGRWVVLMDDDLQNPPEEITKLYAKALEGYDVVCGTRTDRRDTLMRRLGSRLADWLMGRLFQNLASDSIASFRILSRRVVDEFLKFSEAHRYPAVLVAWMGFPQTSVKVRHEMSKVGRSRYSYAKLIKLWFRIAIGFSDYPLRIMALLGIILSGLSFILVIRAIFMYFIANQPLLGYTSLFASQMFFSGIILLCLGVIGEYLARVYMEAKRRPYYIVDKEKSFPPSA